MFNPISHNVVRQSLAWCNLHPTRIQTLLSNEHDNGDQTALYQIAFLEYEVLANWLWAADSLMMTPADCLKMTLLDAFCSDIQIGAVWRDADDGSYNAQLFVTVTAKDSLLDGELGWLID